MIQTQILTSATSAQQPKEAQQGFQVHQARSSAGEKGQQSAQTFRGVSGQQRHQRSEQSHTRSQTSQSANAAGQSSHTSQSGGLQSGQNGFHTQEKALSQVASFSEKALSSEKVLSSQKQAQPDSQDASGIAAILSDILNVQQQRLSQAELENHSHSHRVSAKIAEAMGEQKMQLKGQEITGTSAAEKLSQLTQTEKLTAASALSQTDKLALKSVLLSATEGQTTPSATISNALQTLSAATTQTQHTAGTGTTTQASANGAEWAAVRVDPQSGKWGEQMLSILHDRVTLQAQQNLQEARIRLDPPELGKLDLMVRVDGDKLNVQIHASSTATREALMQVSDRLRTELQNQNFMHVDVNVGAEHQSDGQSYTGQEDEPTIFASRSDHHPDENHTSVTSEHWLNTQA
ncbi:Flagellar hook-length control protein FliK [Vibrio aerogenes CECT 7868]|uniref:Flagellar hook-length control protein FliK n=1 Tax=Vibrio aerogenes CECT 7868 TaxID=1216006 RepID=A0A1M5YK81_9VIBR|nr:flagellar hook-length control protein FliK [Vibrio aerogenes]SHI12445.1 Flagellar hook-length control protein FliK [Vibrio aerogenes CECT 7868]